ncbi:hypothetical protein [Thioalkalivibrio sp. ALJ7]|uniref:hypothetical protein n=1 Tax=Thioalkalivibrio sp. ALJ7 TaxID=1158756 RepID=UPI0003814067|nr:hypothetical protein [Thioalkalivibrio sp. ALJ7]
MTERLVFVYAADSGRLNAWFDAAHKIVSPGTYSCQLCAVTHNPFSMRKEWKQFVDGLSVDCRFIHRDEFQREYPDMDVVLPVVFMEGPSGLSICLDAEGIGACDSVAALIERIQQHCVGKH